MDDWAGLGGHTTFGEEMDQQTAQILVAGAGFAATLLGVVITQSFNSRGETRRRKHEAKSRWHEENYRVCAAIVTKATAVERILYSAAAVLDDSKREPRMPGTKSILLSPKQGIEGVFDRITREIIVEAVEDGFKVLDEMDDLTGELAIIGTPEQAATARLLTDQILDAVGSLEMFAHPSDAYAEILAIRGAKESFAEAARDNLLAAANVSS